MKKIILFPVIAHRYSKNAGYMKMGAVAVCICLGIMICNGVHAQLVKTTIKTDAVLSKKRQSFDAYLRHGAVDAVFAEPLDSNTEFSYESACLTISQFQLQSPVVEQGLRKMLQAYDSLGYSTRRALLQAIYGVYPGSFIPEVKALLQRETVPRLFAMQALYISTDKWELAETMQLKQLIKTRFPGIDTLPLLNELQRYLVFEHAYRQQPAPSLQDLFLQQKKLDQKIIYSFQRWNRDYPGLAVIQNTDGSFARDSSGRLLVFRQLARASSNLPYFITNGNTPQGIYSIQGIAVSHNRLIGPTPNIQLAMPFELEKQYAKDSAARISTGDTLKRDRTGRVLYTDSLASRKFAFWHNGYDSGISMLNNYLRLLPASWRSYQPITEAFYAGLIGRSEIIAHGTTIDPNYFKNKSYYPLTPTEGCLCALETWNEQDGTLAYSDQFELANTFVSSPGTKGYLIVINIDNKETPVSREEIEQIINGR
ncbi:hypothetical protein [Filimonas effusa]|uniref:Uncharacterized protein n=1 Tax=Filimonas effusa TaxID=2508721 RepID=A0A4Q1DCF7_9BACT|nr:hypothetical protein [Filimonas effusa]RXK87147.1 hypothetical protein ESB13_10315 [Filimonas effusa]